MSRACWEPRTGQKQKNSCRIKEQSISVLWSLFLQERLIWQCCRVIPSCLPCSLFSCLFSCCREFSLFHLTISQKFSSTFEEFFHFHLCHFIYMYSINTFFISDRDTTYHNKTSQHPTPLQTKTFINLISLRGPQTNENDKLINNSSSLSKANQQTFTSAQNSSNQTYQFKVHQ